MKLTLKYSIFIFILLVTRIVFSQTLSADSTILRFQKNAYLYHQTGDYERAISEYQKIKYLYPQNIRWKNISEFSIADLTWKDGEKKNDSQLIQESKVLFTQYIQNHQNDVRISYARYALANIYLKENDPQKAIQSLTQIIDSDFTDTTIVQNDSIDHYKLQEKQLLFVNASLSRAGIYLNKLKNESSALNDYEAILSRWPNHPEALLGKATVYIHTGNASRAIEILNSLIQRKNHLSDFARQKKSELMGKGE